MPRDLTTIWRLLIAVDSLMLDRAVGTWMGGLLARRRKGRHPPQLAAVDGKSIRDAQVCGQIPMFSAVLDQIETWTVSWSPRAAL